MHRWTSVVTVTAVVLGLVAGSALALDNTGFEVPDQGGSGYAYTPAGGSWTFNSDSGLSGPNGPWKCNSTSPDPLGDQFAYLQGPTAISQELDGLTVGATYDLSFYEAYRTQQQPDNDLSVILDEGLGTALTIYTTGAVNNTTWELRQTDTFVAAKASYTLTFRTTLPPGGGDRTTIVDGVLVNFVAAPAGGILWSAAGVSNVTTTSADASATVNTNLDEAVLVWDTSNQGTADTGDWTGLRSLGAQSAGTVTGQMTNLLADTEYTWRLYGTNSFPTSAWSSASTFMTPFSAAQIPVFTNAATTWNTVELGWEDNAESETAYVLRRSSTGSSGPYTVIATLAPDAVTYTDGVMPATTYHYQLSVTNSTSGSGTAFSACATNATTGAAPAGTLLFESFEDPIVASATALITPTGWTNASPSGNRAGLGYLAGTAYTGLHGNQAGWLNVYNTTPVLQTTTSLLSTNLVAHHRYTLSFDAASDTTTYTIYADLRAGTNVIGTASRTLGNNRNFANGSGSVTIVIHPGDTGIGETLSVRLRVTGGAWDGQCYVDNLLLTALSTSTDVTAPTPDPMQWTQEAAQVTSNSVAMVASLATDENFVEYLFTNLVNGSVSGWQDSRMWMDSGLSNGVEYTYRVKARDKSINQNETAWSGPARVTVDEDLLFYSSFEWPIVAGETSLTDPDGWADVSPMGNRAGLGNLSGSSYSSYDSDQAAWLNMYNTTPELETTVTVLDAPLEGFTEYTLTFDAAQSGGGYTLYADLYANTNLLATASVSPTSRNFASHQASQTWVSPGSGSDIGETLKIKLRVTGGHYANQAYVENLQLTRASTAGDSTPPTPDPMSWVQVPTPSTDAGMFMVASTATDPSLVEYFFTNTVNGNVSGWQDSRIWTDTNLTDGVSYSYRVKARDKSASQNETAWSTNKSATADASILLYDSFENPTVAGRTGTMAPGWTGSDGRTGLWNEDSGTMTTPYGDQAMYVWNSRYVTSTASSLTNVLEAATTYTLTFNAAAENGNGGIDYDVELLAGSTIMAVANGGPMTTSDMSDYSDTIVFTTGVYHPNLGDTLAVRLRYKSGDWNWVMGYDNVTLKAESDVSPPDPDPMVFSVPPFGVNSNEIAMVATNATDATGPVEYYFENTNTSDNSGWTTDTTWLSDSLVAGNTYAFRVKARDALSNETAWSAIATAMPTNEVAPPSPDPTAFAVTPIGAGTNRIGMTATVAVDEWNNPCEYYFRNTTNGNNSGWISDTSWVDTGLSNGVTYGYTVKARDAVGNETAESPVAPGTPAVDVLPPTPDPMAFDVAPAAIDLSSIAMTAVMATDYSGPVEYLFENITSGTNSGWGTSRVWTNTDVAASVIYSYQVKARDAVSNETAWSTIATAAADAAPVTIFSESFENPPHDDVTGFNIDQQDSQGWVRADTAGLLDEDSGFFVTDDGSQAAAVTDGGDHKKSSTYTTTTNLTATLQANVRYDLSFNVASRDGGSVVYQVELLAGGDVLDRARGTVASADMAVTSGLISFTAPASHTNIGDALSIVLRHPNASGHHADSDIYYDNIRLTTTDTAPDSTPPASDPLTWVVTPAPVAERGLTMVATNVSDRHGVQYFFSNTVNGAVSGWQDEFWWTETNLAHEATYGYKVKARDNSTNLNETAWSTGATGVVDRYVIFYEGFEDPQVYRQAGMSCPGWTANGTQKNEDGDLFTTPFGDQVGDPSYLGGPTGRRIETSPMAEVLTKGTEYTLTFNVGNVNVDNGQPRSDNRYVAEFIAGGVVLTNVSALTSTDDLSETNSLVYIPDNTNTNLGEALKLRFYMQSGDYHAHPLFDNISLKAVPPPPGATVLIVR